MMRTRAFIAIVTALLSAARVSAQEVAPNPFDEPSAPATPTSAPAEAAPASEPGPTLADYLGALSQRRLASNEPATVARLREVVRRAELLAADERYDDVALALFEVVESPRFADFSEEAEFRHAEYMISGALERLGALRTAMHYATRILRRGPDALYFEPALRRATDIALASGAIAEGLAALERLSLDDLPEDATNELAYLRGRAAFDAGDAAAADAAFATITRRSRFYANAQYFRGVIATRASDLSGAEEFFCSIATQGDDDRYTFYVDGRFFEIKDLARLALGRVAHEGRRADDAFYYYFQVPADSDRLAEALFEAAFAMYEGGDVDTAEDLLDQLAARAPTSAFVDEAQLLRGYLHLARCDFEKAKQLFVGFQREFAPVLRELDAILANPARQSRLVDELLALETPDRAATEARRPRAMQLLYALLRVDPTFFELFQRVRTLDAELARGGRVAVDLDALRGRLRGVEAPRAAAEDDVGPDEATVLERDLADARAIVEQLTEQVDAMRSLDTSAPDLATLEADARRFSARVAELEEMLREARSSTLTITLDEVGGEDVDAIFRRDLAEAYRRPIRAADVRASLMGAANQAAVRSVTDLRNRLAARLRRARIGRIDAVMGSKRRIELQIESLAAGRFPAELEDPLRMQGLLRDDEEYWPFEGEDWPDEYEVGGDDDDDDEESP